MTEAEARAALVAEARSWIGTPYVPMAAIKGVGADCGQSIIKIYAAAGVAPDFTPAPYCQDWHMHNSQERYLEYVEAHLTQVENPGLGDVVVFKFGLCFSHGGIITNLNPLTLVHAWMRGRSVTEERIDRNDVLTKKALARRYYSKWA